MERSRCGGLQRDFVPVLAASFFIGPSNLLTMIPVNPSAMMGR